MTTREATLEDLLARVARLRAAPAKAEELFGPQTLLAAEQRQGSEAKCTDHTFEVFQRLHGRDQDEGTGARISARGTPGQGSTFTVTPPLKQSTGS